jgi:hypothetical protein
LLDNFVFKLIKNALGINGRNPEQDLPAALVISQKPDIEQDDTVHKPNEHEVD